MLRMSRPGRLDPRKTVAAISSIRDGDFPREHRQPRVVEQLRRDMANKLDADSRVTGHSTARGSV